MNSKKTNPARLAKALASFGIIADRSGNIVTVRSATRSDVTAEILLPESFPLEVKAVAQLLSFAGASHPLGGTVCKACATPDFHPGSTVAVGTVLVTSHDFVIPAACGTDLGCGMSSYSLDVTLDEFLAKKGQLTELLKGDLLEGKRDIPTSPKAMTALFDYGICAFWQAMRGSNGGLFAHVNFDQVENEARQLFASSHARGNSMYAPEALQDPARGVLRDPGFGTIGSGSLRRVSVR